MGQAGPFWQEGSGRDARGHRTWRRTHRMMAAAGTIIAVMTCATFVVLGLAEFKTDAPDVGTGYMVLAVLFPLAVMAATMWSLRN